MYKLIALDLDGTLLNDDKVIPEKNIKLVNDLLKQGYEVVFATGRRYLAAKEFIDCFDQDLVIIANNGNMVRHTSNDGLIYAEYLNKDRLEFVLTEGKKLGLHPTIHVNKFNEGIDMVCELEKDHPVYHNYIELEDRCFKVDNFLEEDLKILSIVYLGDFKKLKSLRDTIVGEYPNDYKTYLMSNILLADGLLEVVNPIGSKWNSVLNYAHSMGIKSSEIIAVGDDENDLEMIKNAGLGIAMRNAVDPVKRVSDIITQYNNNEAGLAYTLENVLQLKED